jgi:LL-diaminopimelate aminotransferase
VKGVRPKARPGIPSSKRLEAIPPYLFARIDTLKQEARARGMDVIDLTVGDPDRPTPGHIIEELQRAALDVRNHHYPPYQGMLEFRRSMAGWYRKRFGVRLDPEREVLTLIGAKDGISHLFWALVDSGDMVLLPDPGYPVYQAQTVVAGGIPYYMPLLKKNGFLPDLGAIDPQVARSAKLMCLCYPNNPTGAVADIGFFRKVVHFAREHGTAVFNDLVYSELCYDGYRPGSLLQVEGAREVAIEFHSLSKTYNMTGWRIGAAVGNADILAHLLKIKANCDSGVFQAVQWAGVRALSSSQACVEENRKAFQERRDTLYRGVRDAGLVCQKPKATFYLWVQVPKGYDSFGFAEYLLRTTGVAVVPGAGFGPSGEGYVRMAFTVPKERLTEAARRITKGLKKGRR